MLIELKTAPLLPAAAGQVNAYLDNYAEEVNDEFDNPPIGIILCTDERSIDAHYAPSSCWRRTSSAKTPPRAMSSS